MPTQDQLNNFEENLRTYADLLFNLTDSSGSVSTHAEGIRLIRAAALVDVQLKAVNEDWSEDSRVMAVLNDYIRERMEAAGVL